MLRSQGRLTEAVRYQERAKTVATGLSDADLRTRLYLDRAATAQATGDLAEALRSYRAAQFASLSQPLGRRPPARRYPLPPPGRVGMQFGPAGATQTRGG